MSKPILFGFFLACVSGAGVQHHLQTNVLCGRDSGGRSPFEYARHGSLFILHIGVLKVPQEGKPPMPGSSDVPLSDQQDDNNTVVWLLIVLTLIAMTLYTLYEIRKRQVVAHKLAGVRSELQSLFNNIPCGLHSLDDRGVFLNVNDTLLAWLGYEKEEIVGKVNFSSIVEGGEEVTIQQTLALGDKATSHAHLILIKKSGEKMPVLLSAIQIGAIKPDGKRLYCTIDHSECRAALERVKNLDQELEAFSYSISHDLRAPLRSIDGYSRILQEDYASKLDDEGKRVLNVIMTNAKRMGKLIDDLLEFGRLGRKSIQWANIDMTGLVNNIVAELRAQEPHRKIDVHVEQLHSAHGDADMMRQLWVNLLDNAFKYSGKKEVAVIDVRSFETDEREISYEIADNGVGFDMKYAPKLFGVFQRLHKIQDFSGTGVGLAMVKRIVTRHGGRVWAEGSLTHGAKFYFTIPIENENA